MHLNQHPSMPALTMLDGIQSPQDLKALRLDDLEALAAEIRQRIIEVTSKNGGHIGPNLGVVELTIALHRVFSTPQDQFVFDVAHQGYVHKLLTGRGGEFFAKIRQTGGACGFLSRDESPHDVYGAGHAGTALSAAVGIAKARDLAGKNHHVIAVIGDAALTCGITMEAMNNIKTHVRRLIVILNDNEWSIARNVGAVADYLNQLITRPTYLRLNRWIGNMLSSLPYGEKLRRLLGKIKSEIKDFLIPGSPSLFEAYGLRYIGPVNGHDLPELLHYLEFARQSDEPVLIHVLTEKGRGYPGALEDPEKFHGTGAFDIQTGKNKASAAGTPPNYQDVFGQTLLHLGRQDPRVLAITAAMPSGTGLSGFAQALPNQFFDVGIAEEHAVIFAAGLATQGYKPVCAIYSTFLQRAIDPIIHDVCLQRLPVLFCLDRAGLSPNDGPTHHGLFDIAYLRCIPHACIMQPENEDELADMIYTGLMQTQPTFIRYPRGAARGVPIKPQPQALPIGEAIVLRPGDQIMIWALGPMVAEANQLAVEIAQELGLSVGTVNARFIKPLDETMLLKHAQSVDLIVTLEDGVLQGGFGSAVMEVFNQHGLTTPVLALGWPDQFIPHGSSVSQLRAVAGLSMPELKHKIIHHYQKIKSNNSMNQPNHKLV